MKHFKGSQPYILRIQGVRALNHKEIDKMYKKDYKNWNVNLGYSDIQTLTVRDAYGLHEILMGEDGRYSAHVVENWTKCDIPNHYMPYITAHGWMWVYDDEGCVLRIDNVERVEIYRAGNRGILLNIIGEDAEVEELM